VSLQVGSSVDPALVVGQRWLASPGAPVRGVTVEERVAIPGGGGLALLRIDLDGGRAIHCSFAVDGAGSAADAPDVVGTGIPWRGLLDVAARGGSIAGDGGMRLVGIAPVGAAPATASTSTGSVRSLGADQTHTSVVIDESTVLKLYRRLAPGIGPEVELAAALADDAGAPVPAFRGALRLVDGATRRSWDIAVAQRYLPDAPDEFEGFAERIAGWLRDGAPQAAMAGMTADAAPIGRSVARLHASFGRLRGRGRAPRAETAADIERRGRHARRAHRSAVRVLRPLDPTLTAWLVARRAAIERALAPLAGAAPPGSPPRTLQRIHADLHVGQVLRDGDGFLFTDLEGEPTASVTERRRVDLPLRDLASMLRSFDHVARSGMRRSGRSVESIAAGATDVDAPVDAWLQAMRTAFLEAYLAEAGPDVRPIDAPLLHAIEVEKELYEFAYAATYLQWWRYSPAAGLRWLLERGPR